MRPALIIQNDLANRTIEKVFFKGVTVIPLTTKLSGGDLRVRIDQRDSLKECSEVCINELCTLDLKRIYREQCLTFLSEAELSEINLKLQVHLGILPYSNLQ